MYTDRLICGNRTEIAGLHPPLHVVLSLTACCFHYESSQFHSCIGTALVTSSCDVMLSSGGSLSIVLVRRFLMSKLVFWVSFVSVFRSVAVKYRFFSKLTHHQCCRIEQLTASHVMKSGPTRASGVFYMRWRRLASSFDRVHWCRDVCVDFWQWTVSLVATSLPCLNTVVRLEWKSRNVNAEHENMLTKWRKWGPRLTSEICKCFKFPPQTVHDCCCPVICNLCLFTQHLEFLHTEFTYDDLSVV